MSTYAPHPQGVEVNGDNGPFVLTAAQADQLASIYHQAGAKRDFNAVVDALYAHKSQHVVEGGVG